MKLNKLSINYKKTEYIIVINKKEKPSFNLKLDNKIIHQNSSVKYLVVLNDDSLSWKPQINKVCSKLEIS